MDFFTLHLCKENRNQNILSRRMKYVVLDVNWEQIWYMVKKALTNSPSKFGNQIKPFKLPNLKLELYNYMHHWQILVAQNSWLVTCQRTPTWIFAHNTISYHSLYSYH